MTTIRNAMLLAVLAALGFSLGAWLWLRRAGAAASRANTRPTAS